MAKKRKPSSINVRLEAQNYQTTILALHCFADVLKRGNQLSPHSIGRKMTTSQDNAVSKGIDQTPDLVVQVTEKEGYVCEAKATMSHDKEGWGQHVEQLQKYDDDLKGWWTRSEKLQNDSNTILLIDSEKSIKFKKHVEMLIEEGKLQFRKPIAFVGFVQQTAQEESLLFSLDWGKLYQQDLHDELELRKRIGLEAYVASTDRKKFYDAPPPIEYTMDVLWSHVLNDMKRKSRFQEKTKTWLIEINVPDITTELQKLYGQQANLPREVCFPKIKWIRSALEHFEVLGLAKQKDLNNYVVFYKQLRGELLDRFSKARKKMKEKSERKKQIELPLGIDRRPAMRINP